MFFKFYFSIKCNKCNEEYSTKEARRLHTCNSILDQHYLSVDNTDRSNQNKNSSPNSPQSSSANENVGHPGGGAHSSSPPSSFDSASSRSSSPMMDNQWNSNSKKQQPPPNSSVKLIQNNSEKLIIEGRPKLSVTKVSRMDGGLETVGLPKNKYSQSSSGSSSPTIPKLKLMTGGSAASSDPTKKSLDQLDKNNSNKAPWSTAATDNSYNGKLKIKLKPDKMVDKNRVDSSGPEGGMSFAFAGKPTYSPSRIEPSNANGTVQTKGKYLH